MYYQTPIATLKLYQICKKNIPRSVAIYLAIHYAQASLAEVASFLGNVSYPAVAKAYTRFRHLLDDDTETAHQLEIIAASIEAL